jgi:ornithine carbamoyltransferase
LKGRKIAWIGDGNNMAHSLMFGAPKVGMDIVVATPPDYAPDPNVIAQATDDAREAGTKLIVTTSIDEAVRDADIIETDVWASMGQEAEAEKRRRDFSGWMVDQRLMSLAKKEAIFLHCLPAHRGEEVSADIIDGPRSVIYDEAENRLHVQKAIMVALMKK